MSVPATSHPLEACRTPVLLLDRERMRANIKRMATHIQALGCVLRPHVKSHKSHEVLEEVVAGGGTAGITVSTLQEADYFHAAGHTDILYAVGMTPAKVAKAAELIDRGCTLTVITDSVDMVELIAARAAQIGANLPILIELDVDGHRSGVDPEGDGLLAVAHAIRDAKGLSLQGVMTHAGGSYDCTSLDTIQAHADNERTMTVAAAERIRAAGMPCPVVSIGSTPTAVMARDLSGVTEIRPGVYTFFDLAQVGLGVAQKEDIAVSVLTTVIGHQQAKGWVIVDAGWMAMSRDRSTTGQLTDYGYGLACDIHGNVLDDVIMGNVNQEHGILTARDGLPPLDVTQFPIGSMLRMLPNHACATAGQHDRYCVLEGETVVAEWARTNRW